MTATPATGAAYLDDMKRYVGFGPADERALRGLHAVIGADLAPIADRFYEVLAAHPGAMAVITEGAAQVVRLKGTLLEWLASGLLGPHDEHFYERRSRIGRRHVAIGLPQQYMFTAMNVVRADLHDRVAALAPDARRPAHAAVDKLLDLELAIMLRHYQLEAEERMVQRERRAQSERITAMQTLSAGLAHEVRNPLNAAKLQLELLERRLRRNQAEPRLLESTGLVSQEISRLTGLLNEFLSFARPSHLSVGTHDLRSIVQHVLDLERPAAAARGVGFRVAAGMDVDDAPIEVEIDAGKIHQVAQNLIRNAVEASERGQTVEITVEWIAEGATLTVRDHGPGIAPEVLGRIYEPFFSTKEGGTGMGMAIVHSLVALHGGSIAIRSEDGAEITVTLRRHP